MIRELSYGIHKPKRVYDVLALLKTCTKKKDLHEAVRLHEDILIKGLLGKSVIVANALVSMYVRCGGVNKAREILEDLPVQNVVSWNALIAGYIREGCHREAVACFERMQREGLSADGFTFSCILKACSNLGALAKGKEVHFEVAREGMLTEDVVLGSALVDMYVKCGALATAREVLAELPVRDVVTWSTLISGYAQEPGHGEEALICFQQMQCEGHTPSSVTFSCILKACGGLGDLEKGKQFHTEIAWRGLQNDVVLGSALVDMYAKCSSLATAWEVLEGLPIRDLVTWSSLICGYMQGQCHGEEALHCFEQMQREGHLPDAVIFTCMLKACGNIKALNKGKELHAEVYRQGLLGKNIVLGSALVDMYAKCGDLSTAREVLEGLPVRSKVTWNSLIAGYAQEQAQSEETLGCYEEMQHEGHSPDAITFACALKSCGSMGALEKGKEIHAKVVRQELLKENVVLGSALVDMYAKCGALSAAQEVLEGLPVRDAIAWNSLIAGFSQEELHGQEALTCFEQMQLEGHSPDAITLSCILKACGSFGEYDTGKEIHFEVTRQGMLGENVSLGSALVAMHAKCGELAIARQVLEGLPARNVIVWNALMAGYAEKQGQCEEALNCFERLQHEGHSPDAVTFLCILKACGHIGASDMGKQIHAEVERQGLLRGNFVLGSALIDMYVKFGELATAQEVMDDLPVRDEVTWNALIAGYAQEQGLNEEALSCFEEMLHEGQLPTVGTYVCILKICGSLGVLDKGTKIHADVARQELVREHVVICNALVDMYVKCGLLAAAQGVLKCLRVWNIFTWHALIAGYAQHGHSEEAFNCFKQMQCDGFSPDAITFGCMLNACSHCGLVNQGEMYFAKMCVLHDIKPNLEHFAFMVDLFGRAGLFEKAVGVVKNMPFCDCSVVWGTLLGACQKWGNFKLARWAFDHEVHYIKENPAAYVCMSNIYAAAGIEKDIEEIEDIILITC